MERKRLCKGVARLPRLKKYRRAIGRKATRIVSSGVGPAWAHSGLVLGTSDKVLSSQRSVAAVVAGLQSQQSITAIMMLQVDKFYDPIFSATVPL
eukprot:11207534-Lingulodinium_polyedra.AAC.1